MNRVTVEDSSHTKNKYKLFIICINKNKWKIVKTKQWKKSATSIDMSVRSIIRLYEVFYNYYE